MASSYQGFPYVNPVVTDAPSLTADEILELAKWRDLPRRQLTPYGQGGLANHPSTTVVEHAPRLYMDFPDSGMSSPVSSPARPAGLKDLYDTPTVYIDIPKNLSASFNSGGNSNKANTSASRARPLPPRDQEDLEDRPVLYIDIPEGNGSEVSETREEVTEPEFVQETIFYDQFKDRRIDDPPDEDACSSGDDRSGPGSSRPLPPRTLNLTSPGSSSGYDSYSSSIPPMLSKEAFIYGRQPTPDDGFSLTPLPLQNFPASPPPYAEIDRDRDRIQVPGSQVTGDYVENPQTPPRTQVIPSVVTPVNPVVLDGQRKLLTCHHCQSTVQTLVVKENGFMTHALAVFVCFIFFPLVILVYCTTVFRYSNHYCPSCNKKVGYRSPLSCDDSITLEFDS